MAGELPAIKHTELNSHWFSTDMASGQSREHMIKPPNTKISIILQRQKMPQASCEDELFPITLSDPLNLFWHYEFLRLLHWHLQYFPFFQLLYRGQKLGVAAAAEPRCQKKLSLGSNFHSLEFQTSITSTEC